MTRIAAFPGSFDPPTKGHIDLICRAHALFDPLFVIIAEAEGKESLFSLEERKQLLLPLLKKWKGVEVIVWQGLVADYVKQNQVDVLIRGLRHAGDLPDEYSQAWLNRQLCGKETLFLMPRPGTEWISSSLLKEIGKKGGSLSSLIPDEILEKVEHRMHNLTK